MEAGGDFHLQPIGNGVFKWRIFPEQHRPDVGGPVAVLEIREG